LDDGYKTACRLNQPTGVTYDPRDGSIYIADMSNQAIRKYSAKDGYVLTLAGDRIQGVMDGSGSNVRFNLPFGVDLDPKGNLWIADWRNGLLRKLDRYGNVKTMAGVPPDGGYLEGPASMARFTGLMNVRYAPNSFVYLAATDNERIQVYAP
jgi:hypothetical protein